MRRVGGEGREEEKGEAAAPARTEAERIEEAEVLPRTAEAAAPRREAARRRREFIACLFPSSLLESSYKQ